MLLSRVSRLSAISVENIGLHSVGIVCMLYAYIIAIIKHLQFAIMNSENREKYLKELENFLTLSSQKLSLFCDSLGWNVKNLKATGHGSSDNEGSLPPSVCPLDSGHIVPQAKLDSHIARCQWRLEGYSEDDVSFPQCYAGGGPIITLNRQTQAAVIQAATTKDPFMSPVAVAASPLLPQSASRLVTSLTQHQRLSLYEYVVHETSAAAAPVPQLTEQGLAFEMDQPKTEAPKSYLETLADQRDAKRRRLNYRQAKKVHTQHKSQNEVTREVIQNQMELYNDWLQHHDDKHSSGSRCSPTSEIPAEDSRRREMCSTQDKERRRHHHNKHSKQNHHEREHHEGESHTLDSSRHNKRKDNYDDAGTDESQGRFLNNYRIKRRESKKQNDKSSCKKKDDHILISDDVSHKERQRRSVEKHHSRKRHHSSSFRHSKHSKRSKHRD